MSEVPEARVRVVEDAPVRPDREMVVYWMTAFRRTEWNFALDRAVERARTLDRPLLVVEDLRADEARASDRLHRFALDGVADNAARLRGTSVGYHPYVEMEKGAGKGLLAALSLRACVIVGDDLPDRRRSRRLEDAAAEVDVRLEAVDSNGLVPVRAAGRAHPTAHGFRGFVHDRLPDDLRAFPAPDPLEGVALPGFTGLPEEIVARWPAAPSELLAPGTDGLARLPVDHSVDPVPVRGGSAAARERLRAFLEGRLSRYAEERNDPGADAASGLSPYLRSGHVSAHEVVAVLVEREDWTPRRIDPEARGKREGWWGLSDGAEAFLEQLVTWRELGYNMCAHRDDYDRYESLPEWARRTLEEHESDERPHLYGLEEFEEGRTHDALWNAAQGQLLREGRIHNYMRMLWGKKILHWSANPRDALRIMIELNDTYALDGRDPNSYSGIFWCLGRYDRAWGPERPIFGKVRYMTSANTARKHDVEGYVETYGA